MKLEIKGRTIKLYVKTAGTPDPFGQASYTETEISVDNILIEPTSADEVVTDMQMYGKKTVLTLHIPKGDTHSWENVKVKIDDVYYQTIGPVQQWQTEYCPLAWDKKIKVVIYE